MKRGRILRDTNMGPGLVTVDGVQYPFTLERAWRSDIPPRPGMTVDVEFDGAGTLAAVFAVPENRLAVEQASQTIADVKRHGGAIAQNTLSRFGAATIVDFAALVAGWFMLSTISMRVAEGPDLSFWDLLSFVNDGRAINVLGEMARGMLPSKGIYGLLALIALAGPVLRFFWSDRRASLGGLLPILFMLLALFVLRQHVLEAAGATASLLGRSARRDVMDAVMQNVNFGFGLYLSLAMSAYFAFVGGKKFLAQR